MRRVLVGLVLAAVLAACVESDPSTVDVAVPTTTTTVDGRQPGAAAPAASTPRTIVVGGTGAVPPQPGESAPAPGRSVGGPGNIADLLLRPSGATRLAVQVLTEAGAEPRKATLDHLVQVLAQASQKAVTTMGGTVGARGTWSSADLRAAAEAQRPDVPEGTLLLRFLFVHGRSERGDDVLGISVRGDVAAVFVDQVERSATGLVTPARIEQAVAVHELGHLLGLVDLFRDTGRDDPAHPGHSTDRRSVMYWAVESSLVGDLLTGGPPQDFDTADWADLAAIRSG